MTGTSVCRRAGHETLSHFALSLRLCVARCQRRLGRLDEAEYSFKVLAGVFMHAQARVRVCVCACVSACAEASCSV